MLYLIIPLIWNKDKLFLIFYYSKTNTMMICQQISEFFPRINS